MSLKNRYDNVIIRNNLSLGLSHNTLEYVLKLEHNWNELKKWLERERDIQISLNSYGYTKIYQFVIDKMSELEGDKE